MKKKYSSILANVVTIIFIGTFLLDCVCKENKLVYRHWFALSINYYRLAFISILFIILPCYFIIKKRSIWLKLLGVPYILYMVFIILIFMNMNTALSTDSYYTEINGQRVIALEEMSLGDVTTIYYTPVNIFFMKKSTISYLY